MLSWRSLGSEAIFFRIQIFLGPTTSATQHPTSVNKTANRSATIF